MLKRELEARVKLLEESIAVRRLDFDEVEDQRNDALDKVEALEEQIEVQRINNRGLLEDIDQLQALKGTFKDATLEINRIRRDTNDARIMIYTIRETFQDNNAVYNAMVCLQQCLSGDLSE